MLAIFQSNAFPGRPLDAIASALGRHRIYRGRPDAPPGLRRSSTMLTIEQIRWLDRRFGRGRRSEGLRDIITAAMAADKIARGQSPEAGEDQRAGGVATPGAARVSETRPVA